MLVKQVDQRSETGPGGVTIEHTGATLEDGATIIE